MYILICFPEKETIYHFNAELQLNPLVPKTVILKSNFQTDIKDRYHVQNACEIALRLMWQDSTDDKSTLVQVMAWYCKTTSHYLSQCWPTLMSPAHNELSGKEYIGIYNNFSTLNGTGSWNPSLWKPMFHLSCIFNTMVEDGLATQGARASTAMASTKLFWKFCFQHQKGFIIFKTAHVINLPDNFYVVAGIIICYQNNVFILPMFIHCLLGAFHVCDGSVVVFVFFEVSMQELNEIVDILQMTFSNAFCERKSRCLLKVSINLLWPSDAIWRHASESNFVQVMACCHQYHPVTFLWGQFYKRHLSHQSWKLDWKFHMNFIQISQGPVS